MKKLVITLYLTLIIILAAATILEKMYGSLFASSSIYSSWWFSLLWGILALGGTAYLFQQKLFKRPVILLLHLSFVLILIGAGITHFFGLQGTLHLRQQEEANGFLDQDNRQVHDLPFTLSLESFQVENYPGTSSAMDYVSVVNVTAPDHLQEQMHISMNHIGSHQGYRFYQSGYDEDGLGTILSVSYDPGAYA